MPTITYYVAASMDGYIADAGILMLRYRRADS